MLKLTATIVDSNRSLIGFVIHGKEKEFGGFSAEEMDKGMPIQNLIQQRFSNSQIAVVKNKIVEKNGFKINSLPMKVYNGTGYIDIDNTMNITKRFVQDNENIGFKIRFADGSEDDFRYENVIMLCTWFKPGNFSIRTSSKGNKYICGKAGGVTLDDFDAIVIGKAPEVAPKRTKSAAKPPQKSTAGILNNKYDILDVYDFIRDCHGYVIKLPNEEYSVANEAVKGSDGDFVSLGIGEVASPIPNFAEGKLNVNANFKKVGFVPVFINGVPNNITTFVNRSKSIFLNGENYIKRFGIAVPTENEEQLIEKLGECLAFERITDSTIIQPLSQVINVRNLSFFKVDSSKLDLISAEKRQTSILSAEELTELCKLRFDLKMINKAVGPKGGVMKQLKEVLSTAEIADATSRNLFGIFSTMSSDALSAIEAAGIDLYKGSYEPVNVPSKSGGSTALFDNVTIEYNVKGYDASKLTGPKVIQLIENNECFELSDNIVKTIRDLLSISNPKDRYYEAERLFKQTNEKLAIITKKLWMHNASMFINGSKAKIHTHDNKKWIPDTSSRVTTAQVYMCTDAKAEGLTVKFNNVSI